jgi:hypothetical protein
MINHRSAALLALAFVLPLAAHDNITTNITFDKEIVRILQAHCARCHNGNTAFSLLTYATARPWAVAVKEEVLNRRMPPWGAVKGFGKFSNDEGLSAEEIELLLSWIDGGAPEGDAATLPPAAEFPAPAPAAKPSTIISGPVYVVPRKLTLTGLVPQSIPPGASLQITAMLPDGTITPLLWLDTYQPRFAHPFLYEQPITLPAGTRIEGLTKDTRLGLLTGKKPAK